MKKIFQTIVDKDHGNCMQAAIASLFEIDLEEVPNFIELKEGWAGALFQFLKERDYTFDGTLYSYLDNKRLYPNDKSENRFDEIKNMEGVNGYFFATVYSPKYYNVNNKNLTTHAVIIDKDFNIVHHVNSEYNETTKYPFADEIGYNGVINVFMINPFEEKVQVN
jgi:hypothetical protein